MPACSRYPVRAWINLALFFPLVRNVSWWIVIGISPVNKITVNCDLIAQWFCSTPLVHHYNPQIQWQHCLFHGVSIHMLHMLSVCHCMSHVEAISLVSVNISHLRQLCFLQGMFVDYQLLILWHLTWPISGFSSWISHQTVMINVQELVHTRDNRQNCLQIWSHNSHSSQCSTTGVTKAVVCVILWVWCI